MSLVDYASSDEDEAQDIKEESIDNAYIPIEEPSNMPNRQNRPPPPLPRNRKSGLSSSNQQDESFFNQSEPSMLKLPDASLLLNSPTMTSHLMNSDHSSRVAAAMAENASRKRDSNRLASTYPRSKVPKGSLPHSKNIPDTSGGLLRPPQLSGRSNVVTEDISKLFIRRPTDPSSN